MVRKYGATNRKMYRVHRFVWECYNGMIPDGKVIDHINDNNSNNRLCNLQVVTQQENCKKSAKYRDYSFIANNHTNTRKVRATNRWPVLYIFLDLIKGTSRNFKCVLTIRLLRSTKSS